VREIEQYLTYLRAKSASDKTVKTYLPIVIKFLSQVKKPLDEIAIEDVNAFLSQYGGRSQRTQLTVAYALKSFFKAVKSNVDPNLIPIPKRLTEERQIVVIPEEKVEEMVRSVGDPRLKAMIALTYELGLRVRELCALRYGDLDVESWTCYVRRVKGSISRPEPIVTPWVKEAVLEYLSTYKPEDPDAPLFPDKRGGQLSPEYVWSLLKEVLRAFGYHDAHPHDLRHSRATNLLRRNVDVVTVAHLLGHKSLSSTMRYMHLVVEDVRKKLEDSLSQLF